jgi:cytochrome c oxidase subunit 2
MFLKSFFCETYIVLLYFLNNTVWCDAPEHYQLKLQDPSSSIMEGILMFNKHLLFIIILIVCLVGWLLFNTIKDFDNANNHKASKFFHSNPLEIIWTSIPALILLTVASPSFTLLYSMDEISEPEISLKVLGHQWYWSYEISDFNSCNKSQSLKYTCYMLPNDMSIFVQPSGLLRNLETYKRVVLPTNTHIRLLVSATDVLHSWTIPSFGLKVDACPGRLNQMNLFIKRFGIFFGQCSEICGVNHGFMPIVILTVPSIQYHYLIMTNSLLYENIEA